MKKIILRVLLIIGIILLAIAIAAYFLLFREGKVDNVRVTVTDPSGNAYIAVTGEDGKKNAVVADEDGNIWEVEIKDDGSLGTTGKSLNDEYDIKDVLTTYSGPDINDNVDTNAYTGQVVEDTTVPTTEQSTTGQSTTSQTTTKASEEPTTQKKTEPSNIIRYQQMFASGTYYMEFTTNDPELGDEPIITAAKNGNVLIKAKMDNLDCSMLYLADKDKTYLILDNFKKYCSVPQSMLGDDFDMNSFNLMDSFASEVDEKSITRDTVDINGQTLVRESYTTADGSKMSYYFNDGTLVRLDNNNGKTSTETYISKITNDVPDSTFDIPSNYGYLNLSWLDFLGG